MTKPLRLMILCSMLLPALLAGGCTQMKTEPVHPGGSVPPLASVEKTIGTELKEDRYIYGKDQADTVFHLYVTVMKKGKSKADDHKLYSFNDINHIRARLPDGEEDPELDVLVQEGNTEGPVSGLFGYGTAEANASLQIRGNSTRGTYQKSYKLKLFDKAGLWQEQKVLNLNKHAVDLTRVRNKLSFDYLKTIPNFTSMRTHFVQLHIKDLTMDKPDEAFQDYGLYTEIEDPGKTFLKYHGLDTRGQLYKANNFAFYRYPEAIRTKSDPAYDKKAFEQILKIEGSEDHEKLIKMLEDVNDPNQNINDVISKHFDKDNLLTWVAVNILFGNVDTITQNYMLYSPVNSSVWYFMPWDYDGAWDWYHQPGTELVPASWQEGIGNYWCNPLFKRIFMDPNNIADLNDIMEYLTNYINPEQTGRLLDSYRAVAASYVTSSPDKYQLPTEISHFDTEYNRLVNMTEENRQAYYASLEKPMPVFLGEPHTENGNVTFNWDPSFDFQGDDLSYTFQLAAKPDFSAVTYEKPDLADTSITIAKPAAGEYYWRVLIMDSKGNRQIPFDQYEDRFGKLYYGEKAYTANE